MVSLGTITALLAVSAFAYRVVAAPPSGLWREDSVRTDGVVFTRVRDTREHRVCYVLSAQGKLYAPMYQAGADLFTASFQCFPEAP